MAQDYQSIGQASAELERVAAQRNGWFDLDVPQPPVEQETDPTTSFWAGRANLQALGLSIPAIAGYTEPATTTVPVEPFEF